jgi:hypothetical protein
MTPCLVTDFCSRVVMAAFWLVAPCRLVWGWSSVWWGCRQRFRNIVDRRCLYSEAKELTECSSTYRGSTALTACLSVGGWSDLPYGPPSRPLTLSCRADRPSQPSSGADGARGGRPGRVTGKLSYTPSHFAQWIIMRVIIWFTVNCWAWGVYVNTCFCGVFCVLRRVKTCADYIYPMMKFL